MNAPSERPAATMTQAEFARHRGVSKAIVTKWKGQGLLAMASDGQVEVEATEWNLDQRPATNRGGTTHRPIRAIPRAEPDPRERPAPRPSKADHKGAIPQPSRAEPDGDEEPPEFDPENPNLSLAAAAQRKENHLGLLRRQEYLTKQGKLVDRAEAEAAFFDEARAMRDAWLAWPARVGIEMADALKVDARTLTQVLATYVQQHLAELGEPSDPDLGSPEAG
ncbi:hypothetical protein [Methylobacterium sp. 174MFSha1.1]|uniref:hypothetical protein n=1 Tax=Methylobacterium sp. 174MFSha1.1 TaxID=1502749 RepID=UPI0032993266